MGAIEYSICIAASPEDVWRIYADPARIPDWQTGSPVIEEIHGPGDQIGSNYISRRRPGASHTTVVEVDKPRRLVTTTEAYFGLRFQVTSTLTAEGDGTLLGLRAETSWRRGLGVVGRVVEAAILSPREGQKELARLKSLVESGAEH